MDALESITKDFAARRMDKSIRNAFAGKKIDEIETAAELADASSYRPGENT